MTAEISNLQKVYSCSREQEVIKRWTEESIGAEHVVYFIPCPCLIWFDGSNLSHESCTSQTWGDDDPIWRICLSSAIRKLYTLKCEEKKFLQKLASLPELRVRNLKKETYYSHHFFRPALLKTHSRLWIWWSSWSHLWLGCRIHLWLPHWEPSIILLLRSSRVTWSVMVLNGVVVCDVFSCFKMDFWFFYELFFWNPCPFQRLIVFMYQAANTPPAIGLAMPVFEVW